MKRKNIILWIGALIALVISGVYGYRLYSNYRKQVAEWKEVAKATFEEALWMEVNKRAEVPIFHYSFDEEDMTTLKEKIPDTIFVTSYLGRVGYRVERTRFENNLIKERKKRANISILFDKYPLLIDTLFVHWNSALSEKRVPVKNQLRYVYTDLELHNDTVYSIADKQLSGLDSLTVKYLGFRCEHEVVAYVSYSYWLFGLSIGDYCILLLPWILLILLLVYYPKLELVVERKFTIDRVMEKKIIVEKEIHILDVQMDKADILNLPDGTRFDTFSNVLSRGEIRHNIQPKSALLLKLFLSKNGYRVTSEEISWELWQEKREKDKLYSAIRRLRNDLKAVKSDLIIYCTDGVYELKIPISSNFS